MRSLQIKIEAMVLWLWLRVCACLYIHTCACEPPTCARAACCGRAGQPALVAAGCLWCECMGGLLWAACMKGASMPDVCIEDRTERLDLWPPGWMLNNKGRPNQERSLIALWASWH